jgi:DEAD/DEAH box helicase domain-containing protein
VQRPVVIDALRGLASAVHTVATAGLMIDPRDLGRTLGDRNDPDLPPSKDRSEGPGFDPTIFLYDVIPGGVGLAPRLFDEREVLLRRARVLIEGCACELGCPACVGPVIGMETTVGESSLLSRRSVALGVLDAAGVTAR